MKNCGATLFRASLVAFFLAPIPVLALQSSDPEKATDKTVLLTKATLREKSKSTMSYLRLNLVESDYSVVEAALRSQFMNYVPADACKGSFVAAGKLDIALLLVDVTFSKVAYVVLHERSFLPVAKFSVVSGETSRVKIPEVTCESWTKLALIRENYKKLSNSSAAYSDLKIETTLDSVCVVPFDSEMEYNCFSYNVRKRVFDNVGGWFND